jgi:hypothetical protein
MWQHFIGCQLFNYIMYLVTFSYFFNNFEHVHHYWLDEPSVAHPLSHNHMLDVPKQSIMFHNWQEGIGYYE